MKITSLKSTFEQQTRCVLFFHSEKRIGTTITGLRNFSADSQNAKKWGTEERFNYYYASRRFTTMEAFGSTSSIAKLNFSLQKKGRKPKEKNFSRFISSKRFGIFNGDNNALWSLLLLW